MAYLKDNSEPTMTLSSSELGQAGVGALGTGEQSTWDAFLPHTVSLNKTGPLEPTPTCREHSSERVSSRAEHGARGQGQNRGHCGSCPRFCGIS